jgi:hypothetical protein
MRDCENNILFFRYSGISAESQQGQPLLRDGSVNTSVARRRLSSRHVIAAAGTHATIEELLQEVLSVQTILRLYIMRASCH